MGDEDDADEGGKDAEEFADSESLRAGTCANEEGPDGGGRGEDCGGGNGRVLEARIREVICSEPENTECEGKAGGGDKAEVGLPRRRNRRWQFVKDIVVVGLEECLRFLRWSRASSGASAERGCTGGRGKAAGPESLVS